MSDTRSYIVLEGAGRAAGARYTALGLFDGTSSDDVIRQAVGHAYGERVPENPHFVAVALRNFVGRRVRQQMRIDWVVVDDGRDDPANNQEERE